MLKPKKVAMIVWNEFRNDSRVLKEAQTLLADGYDVTVHALHTPGVTYEKETLPCGVKVVRVARSPLWKLRKKVLGSGKTKPHINKNWDSINKIPLKLQLMRLIARSWTHFGLLCQMVRSKPDFVHAHDVNTLPTAWLASVLARCPLVYDAHEISTDREGYKQLKKIVVCIEKFIMPKATGTITTTDMRASFFERAYKIPRPIVLQNKPRLTRAAKTDIIRDTLKLTEDWPIILYQGGLQQGRGLLSVIDVAEKTLNAYFVFIGGGRLENTLKSRVAQLQLKNKCFFIPTVSLDALPLFTASADIGLQPIENTCFNHFSTDSNKLFEYVMAGLPVIASDMPTIRVLNDKYKFGILVKPGSCQELHEAVSSLASDNILRRQLSENSLLAREELCWENEEKKLLNIYSSIRT